MYIKIVINYCCLFVLNSFDGCFVVSFSGKSATTSQPEPVDFWRAHREREWETILFVYLFACELKSFLTMAKEKQQIRNKKKYFEITLYSSFYKSAFENRVEDEVPVCAFVLISKATHTHIRINFVFIQARFGLAARTLFHPVWVSFIYLRIRIFFEKVSFQHFMPTTTREKYRDNTRWRWKVPAAKILAIVLSFNIYKKFQSIPNIMPLHSSSFYVVYELQ